MKQMIQKGTRISLRLLSLVAVLASLLGSAIFISPVEASSGNLVSNPGFENLCGGIPCNWSKTYDESAFSPSTIAHTGAYSLLVTGDSGRGAVSDCVSGIPANALIAIDYYFNTQSGGVTNGYGVGQFYSDSTCTTNIGNYYFSGYGASNPGSWVLSHSEYTSPTGTNSARFQIVAGCGGSVGCPATVLYDDVSVTILAQSCPAGQYDNGSGCVPADPGYYVPVSGATSQTPCPVGTFQPLSGSTSCDPATPGHYVDTVASVAQTECTLGTYQPYSGSISCLLADPGYYVDTTGAVAQTMCPDGYTSDAGASSCYPINTPPTADAGGSYSGDEGSAIALSGASASDSDGDALTYAWSVSSSLCSFDTPSALNPNLTCSDNGNYTVTLSVDDGVNPAVTSNASVTVSNVAPTLDSISVDQTLVPVNTAINASADFTDPGTNDTHTATWDWGDSTSVGTVTESAGSGSVSDSHTYSAPGVYTVNLTVTDKDGGVSNESIYQYVVVYDPSAGFVSGGGWIDSPAGAYMADPSLSGKATFGFVSKYKKGALVPTGNTEFQFKAGDFNFHSDTYDWLVVNQAGTNAQFKGSGTVNGALDPNGNPYKFQLWAGDGFPDTFRIKIWSEDASGVETVVYDNGFDQAIGGGSIVVHN